MKNYVTLIIVAFASLSSMAYAGGSIMEMPLVVEEPIELETKLTPFYIGVGLSDTSIRAKEANLNFFTYVTGQDKVGAVTLLAGYVLHRYLGIEGRYLVSFAKEDIIEMSNIGLFLKPQYPVIKEISVYGLLGYGKVTLNAVDQANVSGDKAGFQWGLGANYKFTEALSIFSEYAALANDVELDDKTKDVDAFTVGLSYRL